MNVAEAQELWSPSATYLNTASYGLPPRPAWDALQSALEDWHGGRTSWEHWGIPGEEARASSRGSSACPWRRVAIGPNVSPLVGLVAASIPDGARVVAPEVDFTSDPLPVPRPGAPRRNDPARSRSPSWPERSTAGRDLVAFSAVQMATGEVADLEP